MRVLAPASVIGTYDGVELFLLSIELWPSGMVVHAACLESELTKWLSKGHDAAMKEWAKDPLHRPRPEHPADRLATHELTVADDVGTEYRPRFRAFGGTGSEWRSQWMISPAPPDDATRLILSIGPETLEVRL